MSPAPSNATQKTSRRSVSLKREVFLYSPFERGFACFGPSPR